MNGTEISQDAISCLIHFPFSFFHLVVRARKYSGNKQKNIFMELEGERGIFSGSCAIIRVCYKFCRYNYIQSQSNVHLQPFKGNIVGNKASVYGAVNEAASCYVPKMNPQFDFAFEVWFSDA